MGTLDAFVVGPVVSEKLSRELFRAPCQPMWIQARGQAWEVRHLWWEGTEVPLASVMGEAAASLPEEAKKTMIGHRANPGRMVPELGLELVSGKQKHQNQELGWG